MSSLNSWLSIPSDSDFSIYNLPFGVFSIGQDSPRAGVAIGDQVIDLAALAFTGCFDGLISDLSVFSNSTLNSFIDLGKATTQEVRIRLQAWLCETGSPIHTHQQVLHPMSEVRMHMPVEVGDYTDFYSSIEHATNVGKMFRDPANALLPNWRHIPVGYHGRASSIVVSGTDVRRPKGQVLPKGESQPVFQASGRVDFELEMGCIIGKGNDLGHPISATEAEDHIFGLVLFNDWSARDIQKWEYVPLGPFLGKSFASSISPWIVTLEALNPFRVAGPVQEPAVLPYLQSGGMRNYDIQLEVSLQPEGEKATRICQSNFQYMYWNMCQQIAHHTINGCNLRTGDMLASGTISGKDENSYGSMLELSWAGSKPIPLSDGSLRTFIQDNDTIRMKGFAEKEGMRVGFGEVSGKLLPSY